MHCHNYYYYYYYYYYGRQVERDELVVYLDELEGKKEQNEALVKKIQERVKELEQEVSRKDDELSELDRLRLKQEETAAELQRTCVPCQVVAGSCLGASFLADLPC